MSVDRPRTGAAATCFESRVAAAAIGSPASPVARFDSRAAGAAMPAGPGTGRTLIGYQPAGALRDAPAAALRAAAEAAALARAVTDSARTTEWEPHEIELTLEELDELAPRAELDPFDPSATIELTPIELAALAAAAAAHEAASAASSAAAPAAVATRSRRRATSPRSTAAAAAIAAAAVPVPALPPSARPAYRCPPRPPRAGLFIGCLAASALLILLYALYVLWALAQASAHGAG